MYLPNTLYERAPQYWLFIGMLLIVLGVYLGIEMSQTFMYVGVFLGVASCAWGAFVMVRRSRKPGEADVAEATAAAELD